MTFSTPSLRKALRANCAWRRWKYCLIWSLLILKERNIYNAQRVWNSCRSIPSIFKVISKFMNISLMNIAEYCICLPMQSCSCLRKCNDWNKSWFPWYSKDRFFKSKEPGTRLWLAELTFIWKADISKGYLFKSRCSTSKKIVY